MRILLAGGGTGGHINPAIAIAQYFKSKSKDNVILFAGTPTGMEAKMVSDAGFDFSPIEIKGFRRSFVPSDISHNLKAVRLLLRSFSSAKSIIKKFNPDIVIGTGGYVSGPIVYMATKMHIKTAIHEQNAFPGATTRFLSDKVDIVLSAVLEAKARLKNTKKFVVVGNPVREKILMKSKQEARNELHLDDRPLIFSFGGSLGADALNILAADIIKWNSETKLFNHIHGYGRLGKEKFPALLKKLNVDLDESKTAQIRTFEYINNMDTCLAAADIVICRSGAITISELEATAKASILVPSPNVTANHQYHNAMVLKEKNACILIEEKDYDKDKLIEILEDLYNNKEKLKALSENASKLAILDTAKKIYDNIIACVNQ